MTLLTVLKSVIDYILAVHFTGTPPKQPNREGFGWISSMPVDTLC